MHFNHINELNLTPSESAIMNFFLVNAESLQYMSVRDVAAKCHVAPSTVIRLVKKLKYANFSEMKVAIMKEHKKLGLEESDIYRELSEVISPQIFSDNFLKLAETVAQRLIASSTIYCVGLGNSAIIAEYAARLFNVVGCNAYSTNEAWSPMLASQKEDDTIICFSISGETRELIDMCARISKSRRTIVAITNGWHNTLIDYSNLNLSYYSKKQSIVAGIDFTSQIPALFISELLAKIIYQLKSGENATC